MPPATVNNIGEIPYQLMIRSLSLPDPRSFAVATDAHMHGPVYSVEL